MIRQAMMRLLAVLALFSQTVASAHQAEPISSGQTSQSLADYPAVQAIMTALRQIWPEASQVVFTERNQFEFRRGQIELGRARLDELARQEAGSDAPAIMTFLLSHEAWHSVQAKRYSQTDFLEMREDKRLECEADAIGGGAAYRLLARTLGPEQLEAAQKRILDYIVSAKPSGPLAYRYLSPADRGEAVSAGWNMQRSSGSFRLVGIAGQLPQEQALSLFCRAKTGYSDGSIGMVRTTQTIDKRPDGSEVRHVTASSKSKQTINASFLAVQWGVEPYPSEDRRLRQVQLVSVTLPPNGSKQFDLTFAAVVPTNPAESGGYGYVTFYNVSGRGSGATSVYLTDDARIQYCGDKLLQLPGASDRVKFSRLVLIGDAALDDFSAIRSNRITDNEWSRYIEILPAFRFGEQDQIVSYNSGTSEADLELARYESDDDGIAEFDRVKALVIGACGQSAVADGSPSPTSPHQRFFIVDRFTRRSSLEISLNFEADFPRPAEGAPVRGGWLSVRIVRRAMD